MICLFLNTVHNWQAALWVTDSILIALDLDDCGLWLNFLCVLFLVLGFIKEITACFLGYGYKTNYWWFSLVQPYSWNCLTAIYKLQFCDFYLVKQNLVLQSKQHCFPWAASDRQATEFSLSRKKKKTEIFVRVTYAFDGSSKIAWTMAIFLGASEQIRKAADFPDLAAFFIPHCESSCFQHWNVLFIPQHYITAWLQLCLWTKIKFYISAYACITVYTTRVYACFMFQ